MDLPVILAFLLFHMKIYGNEEDELAAQNQLAESREINMGGLIDEQFMEDKSY